MVWFLPLIVIAGFFYPLIGYLVLMFMIFMLVLSIFRARFWCWNLCPRGSFLDLILSKISRNRPVPAIFRKEVFRWLVLGAVISFLLFRLAQTGGRIPAIGLVFITMCLISTIIAIILGIITKHRAWCVICPMGLLQEKIGTLNHP